MLGVVLVGVVLVVVRGIVLVVVVLVVALGVVLPVVLVAALVLPVLNLEVAGGVAAVVSEGEGVAVVVFLVVGMLYIFALLLRMVFALDEAAIPVPSSSTCPCL